MERDHHEKKGSYTSRNEASLGCLVETGSDLTWAGSRLGIVRSWVCHAPDFVGLRSSIIEGGHIW